MSVNGTQVYLEAPFVARQPFNNAGNFRQALYLKMTHALAGKVCSGFQLKDRAEDLHCSCVDKSLPQYCVPGEEADALEDSEEMVRSGG